jgi:predicted NUDIX family NTP pyrophosphohydrolase
VLTSPVMPVRALSKLQSAGLLLYRQRSKGVQLLLGHPGGPFWSRKDQFAWTIPKGLIGSGESPLSAAKREFAEETGHCPSGQAIPLGSAKQPGGKVVHVWAIQGDWNPADLQGNTFEMEWPRGLDVGNHFLSSTARPGLASPRRDLRS